MKQESNNQQLSPHFRLDEFTKSTTARKHGIENNPPQEAINNLQALCLGNLEPLREELGLPVIITSGFRTKTLNSLLAHSSKRSQHMLGQAADFYISSASSKVQGSDAAGSKFKAPSHRELLIRAFRLIITSEKIDFDQLIIYPTFIHVSFVSHQANRHSIMKAQGNGKYCALTRTAALQLT